MKTSHIFTGSNASRQTDFTKMTKFRKTNLKCFSRQSIFLPTIYSDECHLLLPQRLGISWYWGMSTSHRGSGSNPSPQPSGQLTSTSQTFMMLCFPPVHCSFCLASHWAWSSWLARERGTGKDMKCNSACFSFLTLADHLHSCTLSPHSRFSC